MLTLPQQFIEEMIEHAREDAPNECCGIIAGQDGRAEKLFRAKNAEASRWRYEVDSKDLYRIWKECQENGWEFLVVYHSHVESEASPSPTDVRRASWPDAYYVLVSLQEPESPVVRAFRIVDGQVSEEELATG
jgi:proteasome lid subunit RPN8/RPN11